MIAMRNWKTAGIAIALLCGSAWAKTDSDYRSVQEICLFSPFLAPAESPVALRSLDLFGDAANGYDFVHDIAMAPATRSDAAIFRSARGAPVAAGSPLKGVYELRDGDWRASAGIVFGSERDWTSFALNGGAGAAGDGKMTFGLSSVPSVGVEHNGFVAGFDMKF